MLNSRPLTPITLDPSSEGPLTPNHLRLQKGCAQMLPGVFSKVDWNGQRRWAQIQYEADQFWRRWRREYLPTILQRQKWTARRSNFDVGDMVLLVDDSQPRNRWLLGRINGVLPDRYGLVRQVTVKTSTGQLLRISAIKRILYSNCNVYILVFFRVFVFFFSLLRCMLKV